MIREAEIFFYRFVGWCGVAVLVAALAACSATQWAATATRTVLPPAELARVQSMCAKAGPFLDAAVAVPATYAYVTEAQAYCKELNAGTVPATTDSNTSSWLPATIRAAAAIAGLIIPLL